MFVCRPSWTCLLVVLREFVCPSVSLYVFSSFSRLLSIFTVVFAWYSRVFRFAIFYASLCLFIDLYYFIVVFFPFQLKPSREVTSPPPLLMWDGE